MAATVLFLASCKTGGDIKMDAAIQHIPSDASQVTVIRVPQLLEKVSFEDLKKTPAYQQVWAEAERQDPLAAKILKDPRETGVNLEQNFYVFTDVNPNNLNDMLNGMMVNISDPAKFAEMVKASPMSIGAKEMDGYTYVKKDGNFVAWADDFAFMGQMGGGNIEDHLNKIFKLSDGASVLSSGAFEAVGTSTNDFSFWLSSDAIANNEQAVFGSSFLGYSPDDLKGNYINGGVNFEEKKMTVNLDFLLKKIIANDLSMPFKSKIGKDFSPYIPKDDLVSVFTFGFDMAGLYQLLKEKNAIGLMSKQMGLNQMGMNLDDIVKAIDGDMMFALQSKGSDGKPAGIFAMTINESAFSPYLKSMEDAGVIASKGNGVYAMTDAKMGSEFHKNMGGQGEPNVPMLVVKDGTLFLTSDPALLEAIKSGGLARGKRIDKGMYNSISSGFMGGTGFPDLMKGMADGMGIKEADIESFNFSINDDAAKLELISKESGNFLKNIIEKGGKSM